MAVVAHLTGGRLHFHPGERLADLLAIRRVSMPAIVANEDRLLAQRAEVVRSADRFQQVATVGCEERLKLRAQEPRCFQLWNALFQAGREIERISQDKDQLRR